jgi:ribulose-phosphate 3-epimerase
MIIPAILEKTTQGFAEKIARVQTLGKAIKRIQVDFADGVFVENTTLAIQEFAEIGHLAKKYDWEAHLMIDHPTNFGHYKEAGFSIIILHYESFAGEHHLEEALEAIVKLGMTPAIAINPNTPVSVLRYFTDNINQFTIMSVHPGKQGNEFIPETYERIEELRKLAPNATIEIDGGVNAHNAAALVYKGADYLAVGSALFETENIKQNFEDIESARTTI